jgi:hypothetical protein
MELRKRVDERLFQHRVEIPKQLDAIALLGGERRGRRPGSTLRGRKVAAKYRSRSGQTWTTVQNMKSGSSPASVIVVSLVSRSQYRLGGEAHLLTIRR